MLPPVAVCRNISVSLGPDGTVNITGSDIDGGSYDPDGTITNRSVTPNIFTCSQKGSNSVTLTVTDNEGLTASCTATVIVEDRTSPAMVCKNITLYLDASGIASLTAQDINNGSSDNCDASPALYLDRTLFSCSDIGSPVSVTLTGTDNSGNSAFCTATVTVIDTVSPAVNIKTYNLILDNSGNGTLLPVNIDNGSFDNCGPVTLSVSPDTFSCTDLGNKSVTLTAQDSHGNSSSRSVTISVSSTLNIAGIALSSCDLAPVLALYEADIEGGSGTYTYLWKGIDPSTKPFMVIIPFPPSLQFFNSSVLESPFFNNTMANGLYDIRLTVTDGNGCKDSSEIRINKTGTAFNNQTVRYSNACEGEIRTYSVNYKSDATYSWSVTNGTILTASQDTSKIQVRWNLGITSGRVVATLSEPNILFGGGQCESSIIDSVTVNLIPSPVFVTPTTSVCSNSTETYTLAGNYLNHTWTVTGGMITAGGRSSDNFVTVRWGTGPSGSVMVSAGDNILCQGSAILNVSVFNLSGSIVSLTNIKCNGGSDGSVTIQALTGTGLSPYMYSIDNGTWQAGGIFTGIPLGNHTAHIRDALLCTFDIPFVITQPAPVSGIVSSKADVSCFGGSDGSITITASGGIPPYQYSLNGGAYQNQNIFNGLIAGPYTLTVRDSNGCTGISTATVFQPAAPLAGSAFITNISCRGASTGAINLTVSGGTSPYTYLWNNGATTEDLLNIPAGNYSVEITDSKGCKFTVNAQVSQPATMLAGSATASGVLCFGASTGAVDLTVSGGTPAYSFLWSNGATTEDLANIPAGPYTVTITDANGCTANASAAVTQPASALGGSVTSQTNVSCRGGSNGSFIITGSGGVAPYQYRIGTGTFQPSGTFGTLSAGSYNITVRDANLCTFGLSVTITEPALALSGTITAQTNVLCFGGSSGSVTIAGTGGTSPYEYRIDGGNFQSSGSFAGLSAGIHSVDIRDRNLCVFNLSATITQPLSAVDLTITSQTNVNCFGAGTGSVIVAGSGGTAPYMYSIDGGAFQNSGTFNNLAAGSHNLTVRDANLCLKSNQVIITQPPSALTVTLSKTDVACFGGATGSATAVPSGGTAPYLYSWNTVPPQTTATATGLKAGNYSVNITDSHGCTVSGNITVMQPSSGLTASTSVTDAKCYGAADGAVNLTVVNGRMPMTFLWSNGATTEDLTGIAAGNYSVSLTDANGCTASASAVVGQPQAIAGSVVTTDVVCFGSSTGSCNLSVTGGIPPYTFLWSNGALTEDIINLTAGSYSVTITDSNLCTAVVTSNVGQPASPLTGTITSQTNVTVYGGSDGSVTVAGSGGTAPYEYRMGTGSFQASGTFGSLFAGSYSVTIRDAALCTNDINITITQPWIPLTARVDSHIDVMCSGGSNGVISLTGWGGTSPYLYSINGGTAQASGNFEALPAGNYNIQVTDAMSGTFDTLIIVTEPPLLAVSVTGQDNRCYGGSEGSAAATVTGGVPPYSYEWNTSPVQSSPTAAGLKAGIYTVNVTDANGCVASQTVTIAQPLTEMAVLVTGTNITCSGVADGTAVALVSGGTPPFGYMWNTNPEQTTSSVSGLSAGTYTVIVTDSLGCTSSGTVEITGAAEMMIVPSVTKASCPDSEDGSITMEVTGGTSPYIFLWSDGSVSANRASLAPGTYSVIVTDQNNCARSQNIEVGFTGSFSCLEIPEIITPNNDGFNDDWRIKNIGLYPDAEISVYNRWGKLVFRTRNISADPWDGTIDGKPVPTDSYHYILRLNDGSKPRSGVISVIR